MLAPEVVAGLMAKLPAPDTWTKEMREAVSAKLPALRQEGYAEDQAAAVAYQACVEEKAAREAADKAAADAAKAKVADDPLTPLDESELTGDLDSDTPKRPSVAWKETALGLYGAAKDHMDSAEATQDHFHIRKLAPTHSKGLEAMMKDIESIKDTAPDFEGDEDADSGPDFSGSETDTTAPEYGKHGFRAVWEAGESAGALRDALHASQLLLCKVYKGLAKAQQLEVEKHYKSVKSLLAGVPKVAASAASEPSEGELLSAFKPLMERQDKLDQRLASIVG